MFKYLLQLVVLTMAAFATLALVSLVVVLRVATGLGTMALMALERGTTIKLPDFLAGAGFTTPKQLDVGPIEALLNASIPSKQQRLDAKAALDAYMS